MSQLGVNLGLTLGGIDALIHMPSKLTLICLSPCQLCFFEAKPRIAVSTNISALYELHLSWTDFHLSFPSSVHLVTHPCCCQSQVGPCTRYCTWIRIPVDEFCILTTLCLQAYKSVIYTKMQPGLTASERLTDAVSCPNQKNYGIHAGIYFTTSVHWGMCTGEVVLRVLLGRTPPSEYMWR